MLLQLCLCVVTVIQLTSSQSTYDVIQQENDVSSCGRTDPVISQLATAVLQIQRDIAELKAVIGRRDVKGKSVKCVFWHFVSSCGRIDQVLSQLLTAVSRMEMRISQLESEQRAVKGTHKLNIYELFDPLYRSEEGWRNVLSQYFVQDTKTLGINHWHSFDVALIGRPGDYMSAGKMLESKIQAFDITLGPIRHETPWKQVT